MRMRATTAGGVLVALVVFTVAGGAAAFAQSKHGPSVNRTAPKRPARPQQNPVKELERFQKMSPDQRQKELDKLPPERRGRFEQQLNRFENLPPEQREKALKRLEALQNLSPERRT